MNAQKGFSKILITIITLVLILLVVQFINIFTHSYNESEVNKKRVESYREYANQFEPQYSILDKDKLRFNYEPNFEDPISSVEFFADIQTFQILDNHYAKDKNGAYYAGVKLEEVDLNSFRLQHIPVISFRNNSEDEMLFLIDRFYKDTIPKEIEVAIDNEHVYVRWLLLKDLSSSELKIEIGNGMGSVISDSNTEFYLKGHCSGGMYVLKEEFLQGPFKDWTKERYLEEYGYC